MLGWRSFLCLGLLTQSVWAANPELPNALPKAAAVVEQDSNSRSVPTVPVVAASPTVNLNTADIETLSRVLVGIGPAKARAIVEHRNARGSFRSVDELLEVRGIGPATLAKNRERLRLTDR